jgi:hypothetical protein
MIEVKHVIMLTALARALTSDADRQICIEGTSRTLVLRAARSLALISG